MPSLPLIQRHHGSRSAIHRPHRSLAAVGAASVSVRLRVIRHSLCASAEASATSAIESGRLVKTRAICVAHAMRASLGTAAMAATLAANRETADAMAATATPDCLVGETLVTSAILDGKAGAIADGAVSATILGGATTHLMYVSVIHHALSLMQSGIASRGGTMRADAQKTRMALRMTISTAGNAR